MVAGDFTSLVTSPSSSPANDFTQGLALYADDPARFLDHLCSVSGGGIVLSESSRKRDRGNYVGNFHAILCL